MLLNCATHRTRNTQLMEDCSAHNTCRGEVVLQTNRRPGHFSTIYLGRLTLSNASNSSCLELLRPFECVNSTSLSLCLCLLTEFNLCLCLCLHTEFNLCLCHSVYHHKWADAQFFMVDAQFFRVDAQFFAAGLLWPRNYAFCCCWTTFTLEIMVLCHVYPLLSMCKLCLPLTEHVQTLYWACAEIIYIIYPVFDSFDW